MSTGQTNTFAMPVVLQNLPPAETLNQVVDNLNYLCNVFDTAFDTITTQINSERSKIKSLQQRIAKASERTDLIAKYPNKSTTVFSHCSFPKEKQEKDDPIISPIEPTKHIDRPKYKLPLSERLKRPPNCDTLKLFHSVSVKTAQKTDEKVVGLGKLPSWLDNVGDCLLFNTDTNPYLRYEAIQNLEGKEGVDKESEKQGLFNAPTSIKDKRGLIDKETYDIAYRPDLENVPTFQVNTTLSGFSGMSGLALDEGWLGFKKQQHKIAPSGIGFEQLPELEALPDFGADDDFGFADAPAAPPKAPTPPPGPTPSSQPSNPTPGGPTPSGPPPEKPAPQPSTQPKTASAAPIKKAPSGGGGGRGALLDAIRAGKALSGSRKERKQSAKAKAAPKRPMSLMDHLKDRLKARNNLMSGKTEASAPKRNVIKPPPTLDENEELPDIGQMDEPDRTHEPDRTGLGLSNVPASMKASMLLLDDPDEMSSGTDQEWNSDD
eukprot:CAMPEP_0201566174 /NCGR_PEP_ID=MMETSP0190_2-20130828/5760_1 /ASSEMBLY_ACC=CAM_ASM_000263 /TAXON_ID=37353 /ORGANISM="Rosalina sp." /LENGTH=490 /DNA_ID=CAMNT_0047984511 /DNA_START=18 /DNA_END=1490 /DNA_ORIENTATION=+